MELSEPGQQTPLSQGTLGIQRNSYQIRTSPILMVHTLMFMKIK